MFVSQNVQGHVWSPKKCRKLMLSLDIQVELFDRLIVPILLYGCEVWCPMMTNLASKLQLRFYKKYFEIR